MVPCVQRRILEQKIVKNAKKAQYVFFAFFAFFASKPAAPAMESIMLKHILIFIGPDYEDLELLYPRLRLIEAGMGVTTAGLVADTVYHGKNGYPCTSDAAIDATVMWPAHSARWLKKGRMISPLTTNDAKGSPGISQAAVSLIT